MDSLIDDAEDVEEMRSNGIIINYLGTDQKVANLFNGMGRSLTHDTYGTAAYNDVKMAITKHCENRVKRWERGTTEQQNINIFLLSTCHFQINHYDRKEKLQEVEKLKARMMVEFVKDPFDDSGAPRKDFYVNVKEELQKARGCYDESITEKFSDEEFIKMMFIDGCFILQFMHCLNYESEKLEMSDPQIFHKVGIRFWPRLTAGAITDVKFKSSFLSGKVEIPPIIIDESTESLLLNLVAYESAAALDQLWVSSYILFMDSLIDDAQDVEELRSNGIIINYLGADQKVAKLFMVHMILLLTMMSKWLLISSVRAQ
uniref:Uncharacterized protein n=1 Tax=Salix viminalis TaxID=40686 RepID=A0A6N2N592_SALVM